MLGPHLRTPVGGRTAADPPPNPVHSIREYQHGYEEGHQLLGFRSSCGFVSATWVLVCPRCGERDLTEVKLSGRGRVVARTIQHVPSDEYLNEAPYAYVVVDLDEGGRLTGWMPGISDDAGLPLGARVHWVESYKPGVQFARDETVPEGG